MLKNISLLNYGAPGAIRTPDLQVRSLLLYPAEPQAHIRKEFIRKRLMSVKCFLRK